MASLEDLLGDITLRSISPKRRRGTNGHHAKHLPDRPGKGLWMKDAFDLVITKKDCKYGTKYKVEGDKKVEGYVQKKEVKICNGCVWLEWNTDGYNCTSEEL